MSWTRVETREGKYDLLRCSACGTERVGDRSQVAKGMLRCWTCRPKVQNLTTRQRLEQALMAAPHAPEGLEPIDGRMPQRAMAYSRAVRYSIEPSLEKDPDAETQVGRIEIAGLRTKNPLNQRVHWTAAAGNTKRAQETTIDALRYVFGEHLPQEGEDYSYEVRISRLSAKGIHDDEGVVAALKGVRDAYAIFVRLNDGNRRRIRFSYGMGQAKVQCVVIEWTRRRGPFPDDGRESSLFFDERELRILRDEHRATRAYWQERIRKFRATKAAEAAFAESEEEGDADDE